MSTTRKVAAWKKEAITQLQVLLEKYPVIAAADLTKVRSSQIHELRKRLRDRVAMVVTKHNIASVLSKLATNPIEAGFTLSSAYDNGTILRSDDLVLDITEYRKDVFQAVSNAFSLSIDAGYVTPENAPRILGKGMREALAIAVEAGFLESGTIEPVLRRAVMNARVLQQKIPAAIPGNP